MPLPWLPPPGDTALVFDLPGLEGIVAGLAVAARGYRPVPVYTSCTGQHEIVQTRPLLWGLLQAADTLERLRLPIAAPPAFLLDARRLSGSPQQGRFDNRSVVTAEDLPTAYRLRRSGIVRVVVVRYALLEDLSTVLRLWRKDGIIVEGCQSLDKTPELLDLRRRWLRTLKQRLFVWFRMQRTSAGGFGAHNPHYSGG
ncbi:MAG: hypothetical protein H0W72_18460 [Planctomycetes bacterium]|nr:hypothetical protein [Planctomycetota bacterium]